MKQLHNDEQYMLLAIQEAEKGKGLTGQNPIVGCVIVEDDHIVAKGYHSKEGGPHAEIEAIKVLGRKPKPQAIMYVTLEPCSTKGRTGACTDAIIENGFAKVKFGALDPNPHHRGRAIEILKQAGIEVTSKILEAQCQALNPAFNERMRNE